jgi:hypothetical protein
MKADGCIIRTVRTILANGKKENSTGKGRLSLLLADITADNGAAAAIPCRHCFSHMHTGRLTRSTAEAS